MGRYFLKEDGTIDRDTPAELPVITDLEPQLMRFAYNGVTRIAQFVNLKPNNAGWPALVLANELWNERDGLYDEPTFKTFHLDAMVGLHNV